NSEITNYDNSYFLPFNLDNTKKCSYAASFGNENINYQSECLTYLKDFKYISVREKQSAEKINSVCSFNAKTHVDPTLLLRKDEWNQLASNRVVDKPYLLIYVVKQPKELIDYAINFAKKNNLEIIQLSDIKKRREIKYVKNVNPSEFLMYFRDASYIFTNSFHGTVFSIIFQKEYFIELISLDGSTNTRSQSLLKELDLEVSSINKKINWSEIEKRVANQREESINYLKEINNRF
ncbi:polysaccharide pyruvyl transferase family protein, partial [Enterococcus faecalis]|nr:polysaccharide pyruvyl transferase family protein [Enterococcus faecalis]